MNFLSRELAILILFILFVGFMIFGGTIIANNPRVTLDSTFVLVDEKATYTCIISEAETNLTLECLGK